MKVNPSIFKAYDIRGLYPQDINLETITAIVKAVYTFFVKDIGRDSLMIVLGRDMRISSPELFDQAAKALVSLGATVLDIGLASTPTFYFAIRHYQADCGIQISASHNPKDYNGMKFAKRIGDALIKVSKIAGMDEVKNIALTDQFLPEKSGGLLVKKSDTLPAELDEVFDLVKPVHLTKLKVVADAANAMGSVFLDALFERLPEVIPVRMNFTLDGTFPAHQPDPLQFKLLADLQKRVIAEKADFGIAPDGDGDRVFFIDERGSVIPATHISSLIAHEMLAKFPGEKILVDIRYTRNVSEVTRKCGGSILISKIGHALITEQLNREHAIFAGESSGHYYFLATGGAESSLRVILMLLEIMGREKKPISQILAQYATSIESGEINFTLPKSLTGVSVIAMLAKEYAKGTVSMLDGISVDYPDWRFNVRTSNTEPLLRLNVEGSNGLIVNKEIGKLKEKILSLGASIAE